MNINLSSFVLVLKCVSASVRVSVGMKDRPLEQESMNECTFHRVCARVPVN